MACGFSRLLHPVRSTLDRARARALRGDDLVKQTTPVKGFRCGDRESTQAERELFQRRMRVLRLLQHQHRETGEPQLAREKQADGAGTGDDDVVVICGLSLHETLLWSMFDRSVPRACENHTDERLSACVAPDVRRGDLVHKAKDQSFRYRKDLGLPDQICLFRRGLYSFAGMDAQRKRHGACGARAFHMSGVQISCRSRTGRRRPGRRRCTW